MSDERLDMSWEDTQPKLSFSVYESTPEVRQYRDLRTNTIEKWQKKGLFLPLETVWSRHPAASKITMVSVI